MIYGCFLSQCKTPGSLHILHGLYGLFSCFSDFYHPFFLTSSRPWPLRPQFSLATPVGGMGECGLRFGTEMVNGGDISNQLISAGKCSLCLSRCDQSVTTVGVCWWNCLGTSMFVNVRRCSSCSYGKDLKSFAHIPRCPDAGWIDDRNVSTNKFMGQNKHCFR